MKEPANSVTGDEFGMVVQVGQVGTLNVHPSSTSPGAAVIGRPVSVCSPLDLEVHSTGDGPLPPYVRRPHDRVLDRAVHAAIGGTSGVVVLVGGSSTGKTRACWEAVRRLPTQWRLWHPISPGRPQSALADLGAIAPHTVVWLNETHHYLLTPGSEMGEQVAAGLRELLRSTSPVLILGTLWPEFWQVLTREPQAAEPDLHAHARALLSGTGTRVADEFTAADAATATGDARLVEAALRARDRQVAQYLAGAPALLERFRTAPPPVAAIITAAMDVRRLGHGLVMSPALLEDAASGYLTDAQWNVLGDTWFADALAACAYPGKGGSSPLSRTRPRPGRAAANGYQLEDYLEHTSRLSRSTVPVPEATWSSLLANAVPEDHLMLATAARARGLYRIAALFYLKAGTPRYIRDMLTLRQRSSQRISADRTAEMFKQELAEIHAIRLRTEQLVRQGRTGEALRALDEQARAGVEPAERMAEMVRIKLGMRSEARREEVPAEPEPVYDPEVVLQAAAELGEWPMARRIGGRLLAAGERDRLLTWLRGLAVRHSLSPENLLLALRGFPAERDKPAAGYPPASDFSPASVRALLAQAGENNDERMYFEAFSRFQGVAALLQHQGHSEAALEWYLLVTEAGHGNHVSTASILLRQLGRDEEADRLLHYGIEPGGRIASAWQIPEDQSPNRYPT